MAVAARPPTLCQQCGKSTATIHGRCPNCAFRKDPDAAIGVVERRAVGGSFWDDLEDFGLIAPWLGSVVALGVLGLVFSLDVLLVIAAVAFAGPLAVRALVDWL